MPSISVPYTFSNGGTNTADANQVNANFAAIVSGVNGLSIPTTPVTIANGGTGGNSVQTALTALGLGAGIIISCTATTSGSGTIAIVATTAAGAPTVSAYEDGLALLFRMPNTALTGSEFTIAYTPNGGTALGAVPLYDAGAENLISSTAANQIILALYSAAAGVFCVVNTPPSAFNSARFAQFLQSSSTQTWTAPAGVTTAYATACASGGAGGGSQSNTKSGGGGGGGGDSIVKQIVNVTAGGVYNINVGVFGVGGAGANGGNGNPTNMISVSSGTTLVALAAGLGGTAGTNTSAAPGGNQGGSGGSNGREGFYAGSLSVGGAGGDCILGKGGTPAFDSQNGQNGQGFGSGGAGASGSSAGSTTGGSGAPGYFLLEW